MKKQIQSKNEILDSSMVSGDHSVENLVCHIQRCLGDRYKIGIYDIPTEYIKNDSTKCVEISEGDLIFCDWYYNEFNVEKIMSDAEKFIIIDRDMDPVISGKFKDIGQKILLSISNLI